MPWSRRPLYVVGWLVQPGDLDWKLVASGSSCLHKLPTPQAQGPHGPAPPRRTTSSCSPGTRSKALTRLVGRDSAGRPRSAPRVPRSAQGGKDSLPGQPNHRWQLGSKREKALATFVGMHLATIHSYIKYILRTVNIRVSFALKIT